MLANVTCHVESRLPQKWTANTLTVIGNMLLPIIAGLIIYVGGLKYHNDGKEEIQGEVHSSWMWFLVAFGI